MLDLSENPTEDIKIGEYTDDLNFSGNTNTIAGATLYWFVDGEMRLENMKHYSDGKNAAS